MRVAALIVCVLAVAVGTFTILASVNVIGTQCSYSEAVGLQCS